MKSATVGALVGSALLSLTAQPVTASAGHGHVHREYKKAHSHGEGDHEQLKPRGKLTNRSGQCAFPEDAGLVIVTPSSSNAGWAMSPDEECTAGSYCPFACPSGQVMNQWMPGSTYVYPESMYGGLYCDESGEITKPYPDREYCTDGVGTVNAVNNADGVVAFCQTVLPGNEAMLIPTSVDSTAVIAVPGTSYWDSTAAHYYVNTPGYTTDEACIWGTSAEALGNWSPYVAGANQDATGDTYVKIGWNPKHEDDFYGVLPTFGIKIECPDGECNGLPCSIDPSTDGYGGVTSDESASGAGGADFCVVTVTSGSANIVVFDIGDSSSSGSSGGSSASASASSSEPVSTSAILVLGLHAEATTSSSSSTTTSSTSTTSSTTTTSSTSTSSTSTSSTSTSSTSTSSTSISSVSSRSSASATTTSYSQSYHPTTMRPKSTGAKGGIFQENDASGKATTASATGTYAATTADTTTAASASASSTSDAGSNNQGSTAFAGLVVAFVAAACLY